MGRVAVYYEAAVVIISLTMLGQIIELKARSANLCGDQGASSAWHPRPPAASTWMAKKRMCR